MKCYLLCGCTALARRCNSCGENLYEFDYRKGIEVHDTGMYDLLSQSHYQKLICHEDGLSLHACGRLGGRDQGNIKKETSIGKET